MKFAFLLLGPFLAMTTGRGQQQDERLRRFTTSTSNGWSSGDTDALQRPVRGGSSPPKTMFQQCVIPYLDVKQCDSKAMLFKSHEKLNLCSVELTSLSQGISCLFKQVPASKCKRDVIKVKYIPKKKVCNISIRYTK